MELFKGLLLLVVSKLVLVTCSKTTAGLFRVSSEATTERNEKPSNHIFYCGNIKIRVKKR